MENIQCCSSIGKQQGAVSAKKAGTATITAAAADGSGKKSSCKVTVINPVKIASASIVNSCTIKVSLTSAQTLNMKNFTVNVKMMENGSYNKVCELDNLTSADATNYTLVLKSGSRLYENEKVKVTVTELLGTGSDSREAIYSEGVFAYEDYQSYTVRYNETMKQNDYLPGRGYSACTVTGLPQGIKSKITDDGSRLIFYGKPTQKGVINSKIVSKDELGNSYSTTAVWLVYSPDMIAAAYTPMYTHLDSKGEVSVWSSITNAGGSGSYRYSFSGNSYGLSLDKDGAISGILKSAGSFNLQVVVQDEENPAIRTTVPLVINVANSKTIAGMIKDAKGNPIPYANVEFINKDKANRYTTVENTGCDENGNYSITVVDGTYDIRAYVHNSQRYLYSQTINTSRSGFDISLPVYRIAVYSNNQGIKADTLGSWTDELGDSYGYGDQVYLKEGSYSLTAKGTTNRKTIEATLNITVTATTTSGTAAVVVSDSTKGEIKLDQPLNIVVSGQYIYYRFTPTQSGSYDFYTTGSADTEGTLEDESGNWLADNDDYDDYLNFKLSYYCEANQNYYIRVNNLNGDDEDATLHVTRTP